MSTLAALWQRILSWFRPAPKGALAAMDDILANKPGADPEGWRNARASFVGRVFSERDRKRLWRRARRHHPNAAEEWEPGRPSQSDLACLEQIVSELAR